MLFVIYLCITGLLCALIVRELLRSRDWREQGVAALVLVPLLLRVLLIK
ncbi:MAG: hypothetical protein KDC10_07785 [Calditrichaeota bacterium]|nr:hypothetical protein [Candidatus Cloacimonadota bacterium]MCA9785969.1 hypothetical protein [Candidatus Cloacimonadota bacterium]MCB1047091.1 hypothetical protein [Calditrichota bacterium]MCB9474816.1 hypothetical protein [Candidatus Delongbacteria bacterium]